MSVEVPLGAGMVVSGCLKGLAPAMNRSGQPNRTGQIRQVRPEKEISDRVCRLTPVRSGQLNLVRSE